MAQTLTIGELVYKLTGDSSLLEKELKESEKKVTKFGKKLSGFGKKVGSSLFVKPLRLFAKTFAIATPLITAGLALIGKSLVSAASDAEETQQKFSVVFSGIQDEAEAVAASIAKNYGLSRVETKKLLSSTGDLLTGFGFTQKEALDLSAQVQTLGTDLASFSNIEGGAKFASEALTKALLGEREQLKSLGIVISEAAIKQELIRNGQENLTGTALLQAKAQATLKLAYEQSGNALGDFERSQSSFANQTRIAEANIANLKAGLGKNLLPVAGLGVKAFNNMAESLDETVQEINDFVTSAEGAEKIGSIIGNIAGAFSSMRVVVEPILEGLEDGIDLLSDAFDGLSDPVGESTVGFTLMASIGKILGVVVKGIFLGVSNAIKVFIAFTGAIIASGRAIGAFIDLVRGKISREEFNAIAADAGDAILNVGVKVKEAFSDVVNFVKDDLIDVFDGTEELANKAADSFTKTRNEVKKAVEDALLAEQEVLAESAQVVEAASDKVDQAIDKTTKKFEDLADKEKFEAIESGFTGILGGLQGLLSGAGDLQQAFFDQQLINLDEQEQAALEQAGLLEETEKERLQAQLEEANATGDDELAAETERELKRLAIAEDFEKQRAKIEYKAALAGWQAELDSANIQVPIAALNAFVSSLSAPWPLNMVLAPANAALATAGAIVNVEAIRAARPQPPKFQAGGFAGGPSHSGGGQDINIEGDEHVTRASQARQNAGLLNAINNGGGALSLDLTIILDDERVYGPMTRAFEDRKMLVDFGAIKNTP